MTRKNKRKFSQPQNRRCHEDNRFNELLGELSALHATKNFDYASGGIAGPMGNFHRVAALLHNYPPSPRWHSAPGIALTYMLKQLDATLHLLTTGNQSRTGENIDARLRDVATYAIIAIQLIEEEEK